MWFMCCYSIDCGYNAHFVVSKMSAEYASKLGGASMPVDMEGGKKKRKKRVVDPNAPKYV